MTKLQQVRAKIIEAVPEIMELKFGCRGMYKKTISCDFIGLSAAGNFIWTWQTGKYALNKTLKNLNDVEILGRPIRLADVLIAIVASSMYDGFGIEMLSGTVSFSHANGGYAKWNLHKDSLDDQNEELVDFLHTILC